MKRAISLIAIPLLILSFTCLAKTAAAQPGLVAYMTDTDGGTNVVTEFALDETPWLYLKLPQSGTSFVNSFWHAPDATLEGAYEWYSAETEKWLKLDEWDTVKMTGTWEVAANAFYSNGVTATAWTSFTVTPEPLATALFLVGGVPIALSVYNKRKKYSKKLAI